MLVTILVENYAAESDYAEWGFAALVEKNGKRILFDTGLSGECLLKNSQHLAVDLKNIDAIVLSHGHDDHTGGLKTVLQHSNCKKIYAHPDVFLRRYSLQENGEYEDISFPFSQDYYEKTYGVEFVFRDHFSEIVDDVFMTGVIPMTNKLEKLATNLVIKDHSGRYQQDQFLDDNSLVIRTEQGVVILFGCAHRGIVNIMEHVKKILKEPIYAIIGGTHLYRATDEHFKFVTQFIERENIRLICPAHCTGMDRIFDLKQFFKERVQPAFSGKFFKF